MRKPLSSFETGWLSIQQILFSILSIVLYFMQKYFLTHKLMRKQYRNWFSRSIIVGILYSYTITALILWDLSSWKSAHCCLEYPCIHKVLEVRISKVRLHDLCLFLQHCSHDVDDVIIEGCQYYLIVTILDWMRHNIDSNVPNEREKAVFCLLSIWSQYYKY